MYLSNAEKEALFLTGYGDVPPWAVQQGLEQALARGTYVPGEEALRLRLAEQLDLEERLATAGGKTTEQQAEELQESADVGISDLAFAAAYNEMASYVAEGFQQGLAEGIEASQEAAATEEATTEGQEVAEEPPTAPWRSPLEIVTDGAEEPEQGPSGGEDAAPAAVAAELAALPHLCSACTKEFPECDSSNIVWGVDIDSLAEGADADKVVVCDGYEPAIEEAATWGQNAAPATEAQRIEDRDFSSFTKTQWVSFAWDQFGVELKLTDSKDELIAQVQQLVDEANEKAVGAEEPEQEPPGEEDAAPAAGDQQIEDRDFSSFTKTQLVSFAWDQFGVELKRTDSRDQLIIQVQRLVDEANG